RGGQRNGQNGERNPSHGSHCPVSWQLGSPPMSALMIGMTGSRSIFPIRGRRKFREIKSPGRRENTLHVRRPAMAMWASAFTMNDIFGDARHDPVFALHSTRERRDGEPAHCRAEAGHAAVGRSHWPRRNLRLLEITERGPGMGAENDNA